MKVTTFIIIIVFFISCEKKSSALDIVYGEWIINEMQYKTERLTVYNLYIDKKTNWLIFENKFENKRVKANYKLYFSKKKEIFFDIYNSTDKKFDGEFIIEIDTIFSSPQRDEISVEFQSNDKYFKCYKNIVKKIGQ